MSRGKEKTKWWWISLLIISLVVVVGGFAIGWWSEPTLEEQIRDAQLQLLKEVVKDIGKNH